MSEFRTIVDFPKNDFTINHQTGVFLIGSCFANNIGEKLKQFKFPVIINPFGVLYNPVSIKNSIEIVLNEKYFEETGLNFYDDKWFSFYHHTSFSHPDKEFCLKQINDEIKRSAELLKNAQFLFVTFGTARVYEYLKTGRIVSNCHKIPAKAFNHYLIPVEQIVREYENLLPQLFSYNKNIKVIFTVSPIRHWKDGATGNLVSKSVLVLSIHSLLEKFSNVSYFPAYEIMMDDLRDYRFYEKDMIHPNNVAIDYLWKSFSTTFFSESTQKTNIEIEKIIEAVNHKPVDRQSPHFKLFVENSLQKINNLQKKYPYINFEKEIDHFNQLLMN